jgi:hypothetical protein
MRNQLARLDPRPDQLYVIWSSALAFQDLVTPLGDLRPLRRFKAFHLASGQRTPIAKARLRQFGIDDLYVGICRNPNVFLVCLPEATEVFGAYFWLHYGLQPAFRLVNALRGRPVVVVQGSVSAPPPDSKPGR